MRKIIYTCIIGAYQKLLEPKVVTGGWEYVCVTDQPFKSDVWKIYTIGSIKKGSERAVARKIKALYFKSFKDCNQTVYIDGSFCPNCDLDEFWKKHFDKPFSVAMHPQRDCVYEEAKSVIKGQRGGSDGLEAQIKSYEGIVPPHNGLISSGILLRENTPRCIELCEAWFKETSAPGNSLRDQISMAKVSMDYTDVISTFQYRYDQETDFKYTPHSFKIIDGVLYH